MRLKITQRAILSQLEACFSGFEAITVLRTVIEHALIITYFFAETITAAKLSMTIFVAVVDFTGELCYHI